MEKKQETFIYEGLGFPIELIDAPMKKIIGEWIIDIDMNVLQKFVFNGLIHKPYPLTGKEVKFMRKFLEMTTTELGEKLGLTHASIVKWENGTSSIDAVKNCYVRMVFMERFKDSELINLFKEITPEKLTDFKSEKYFPLPVNAKLLCVAV